MIDDALVPPLDEDIPLPASATVALPELSPQEELNMRVRTIKLISDLTGAAIVPDDGNIQEAEQLARQMIENPEMRPDFATYPNETIAYLAGMVSQMNHQIVGELSDLKLYVVNKLVFEVEHAKDSKSRIAALAKLGEIDGVDAFKRRSEVTMKVQPIEEVEKELLDVLQVIENVEYKKISGEPTAVSPE